jgi:hypothetical protein
LKWLFFERKLGKSLIVTSKKIFIVKNLVDKKRKVFLKNENLNYITNKTQMKLGKKSSFSDFFQSNLELLQNKIYKKDI